MKQPMSSTSSQTNNAVLLISCPDQEGIVAHVTTLLSKLQANILYLDQYVDNENQLFFMRVSWSLNRFSLSLSKFEELFSAEIAQKYSMNWNLYQTEIPQKMAIFVSKYSHCLFDILGRWKSGNLAVEIPVVISNHNDLRQEVENLGIDFYHIPVTAANREEQVALQLEILSKYNIDLITLARYMQIIPPSLIEQYQSKIINIHHSFLPGFPGAKPYHQAYQRGVKLIGATAHYVTTELDAGPIIEQDVQRITHTFTVDDLVKTGQDIEMRVLSRAISAHLDRRVYPYKNRTVVFS